MKIAINTTGLLKNDSESESAFIIECFIKLASQNPGDEFFFICDRPIEAASSKNISSLIIDADLSKPVPCKLWYDYRLPVLLRKNKFDVLINTKGFCLQRTKIPQFTAIPELSFLDLPKFFRKKQLRIHKKWLPKSIQKSTALLTFSNVAKEVIIKRYGIDENKITTIHTFPDQLYTQIDWKEKEAIKEKYTEGKEFFSYTGPAYEVNNLITLLKAFSFFKKRQKSNMQLVICPDNSPETDSFAESLQTYKYRDEIKLMHDLSKKEAINITASAYAFLYPSYYENTGAALMNAMNCAVPIITSDIAVAREICADAALYAMPDYHEELADSMMLLFKNEKKRNELIEKGQQRSQQFTSGKTLKDLWRSIREAVQS